MKNNITNKFGEYNDVKHKLRTNEPTRIFNIRTPISLISIYQQKTHYLKTYKQIKVNNFTQKKKTKPHIKNLLNHINSHHTDNK